VGIDLSPGKTRGDRNEGRRKIDCACVAEPRRMTRCVVWVLTVACGLCPCGPDRRTVVSQRPIKMIVAFPPGGPVDVSARLIGQHLP